MTLSIPDELLAKSRKYAHQHGTTFNDMVRDLLKKYVAQNANPLDRFLEHTEEIKIETEHIKWARNELYD